MVSTVTGDFSAEDVTDIADVIAMIAVREEKLSRTATTLRQRAVHQASALAYRDAERMIRRTRLACCEREKK